MSNHTPSNNGTNAQSASIVEQQSARLSIKLNLPREKREPLYIDVDEPIILGEGIWGVFGQSGAGKSTLLKTLAGLYKSAKYSFSLKEYRAGKVSKVKSYTGLASSENPCVYVGAQSILFDHLNVADNLRLVQKQGAFSRFAKMSYQQIVDLCGIQHLLKQNTSALSSGEAQRVKFARALLSGKACILLDEAFSALDWPTRRYFSSIIVSLHQQYGLAFVVVSHSLRELALCCTHISECFQGKLRSSGSATQMLEHLQFANAKTLDVGSESVMQSKEYSGDVFSLLTVNVLSNDLQAKLAECILLCEEKHDDTYRDGDKDNKVLVRANTPLAVAQEFRLTLDADKVSLSTQLVTNTSMLNSLCGKVIDIKHYNSVVLVTLLVARQKLHAAISIRSFNDLNIKLDDTMFALFKAL